MKIVEKPVNAYVECPLCNCKYVIKGKDWRLINKNRSLTKFYSTCPNCFYEKEIIPAEVKCAK